MGKIDATEEYLAIFTSLHLKHNLLLVFPAGIFLSLHGLSYSNNSVVNLTDIGDSNETGLICHTNHTNCCKKGGPDYLGSRWWYPGNRTVTSNPRSREAFT